METPAGQELSSLVTGPSLADVPVPACLNHCINQEAFCCKICDEPFDNIHTLVDHGKNHLGQADLTCAFCGKSFSSFVALSLHQLMWQAQRNCSECGEEMENEKQHECHLAAAAKTVEDQHQNEGRFKCPLLCSKVHYPLENLKAHLVTFHGCETNSVELMKDPEGNIQGVKAELGPDAFKCPNCETRINCGAVKLENHVILSCSARSGIVTQRISNLASMAEEMEEDQLLVMKQEIDASLLHYTNVLESEDSLDKFLQQSMAADRRYDKLPANFSMEYLGHRIPGHTHQLVRSEEDNLIFKFGVWSQLVEKTAGPEDIQDLVARFDDEIMSLVKSGVNTHWAKLERDPALLTDMPDSKTLADLEQELGFMQSGCPPRDLETTVKQLQVQMKSIS